MIGSPCAGAFHAHVWPPIPPQCRPTPGWPTLAAPQLRSIGRWNMGGSRDVGSLRSTGPPKTEPLRRPYAQSLLTWRGARAASQRVESRCSMPTLTSRRCAPSPCATRAPIPDSGVRQLRGPSSSAGPIQWERPSGGLCASAAGAPPLPPHGRWRRPPFWRPRRFAAAPTARIRALSASSRPQLRPTGGSLRARRHLYARRRPRR